MWSLTMPDGLATLGAWLGNYLCHSTLFLALAWAFSRKLGSRALATQEWTWKLALVAGLLTAGLALGSGGTREGLMSLWSPAPTSPALRVAAPSGPLAGDPTPGPATLLATSAAPADTSPAPSAASWLRWLAALWGVGALGSLALLALRWRAFRQRLVGRLRISAGPLRSELDRLRDRARLGQDVELSQTRRLLVPCATGLTRPEICLPDRAVQALPTEAQHSILAHEMAHLARRDPLWQALAKLIEALLFFQPLNRLAARRLAEIAELRADDWAVAATGRPRELALCLTEVAGWMAGQRMAPLPVPGMAVERSSLGRRVERLLSGSRPNEPWPRFWLPAVLLLLVGAVTVAPGFSLADRVDAATLGTEPTPPEAPRAHRPARPRRPAPPEPPAPRAMAEDVDAPAVSDVPPPPPPPGRPGCRGCPAPTPWPAPAPRALPTPEVAELAPAPEAPEAWAEGEPALAPPPAPPEAPLPPRRRHAPCADGQDPAGCIAERALEDARRALARDPEWLSRVPEDERREAEKALADARRTIEQQRQSWGIEAGEMEREAARATRAELDRRHAEFAASVAEIERQARAAMVQAQREIERALRQNLREEGLRGEIANLTEAQKAELKASLERIRAQLEKATARAEEQIERSQRELERAHPGASRGRPAPPPPRGVRGGARGGVPGGIEGGVPGGVSGGVPGGLSDEEVEAPEATEPPPRF